ncbi:hypothetical protein ICT70_06405 [Pelobacter sp. M08fum]|uniref:Uncharacterized protein n=2 Tax=Pelovirga terrestris TaxID=2771352 RepID=A0A8J6QWW4_9BACT|nr:hypothetical protein [Pelovirga terrestris]
MSISGNPKKFAQALSDGFVRLSPPMLKGHTPGQLKTLLSNLEMVQRELRQIPVSLDDVDAVKQKNYRTTRLTQAEMILRTYCKKMRIPL